MQNETMAEGKKNGSKKGWMLSFLIRLLKTKTARGGKRR